MVNASQPMTKSVLKGLSTITGSAHPAEITMSTVSVVPMMLLVMYAPEGTLMITEDALLAQLDVKNAIAKVDALSAKEESLLIVMVVVNPSSA